LDFVSAGYEWTDALCEMDSDGDGRSNGVELGDPDCVWMEGTQPDGPALSHPGIVDEPKDPIKGLCDDYITPDDELTMDIVFSVPTQIDESRTHYICEQQLVDVPVQEVVHLIKNGVLLDNSDILHHMFVFVCDVNAISIDGDRVGEGPYSCSGNESGCLRVAGWALGPHEKCTPPNVGEEINFSASDKVVVKIEAHYDNSKGTPQQDQSGIRLYLTPTLRPLSGTRLAAGLHHADSRFVIPAQQSSYTLTGVCPSVISEYMIRPIYAYAFNPHMHQYGRSMVTEHYRCGNKIGEIGHISEYEFDNQQSYTLNPPVKILPGDALVTTCKYDTSNADVDVKGGEQSSDEMCMNFISVYPHPGTEDIPSLMTACLTFEGIRRNNQTIDIRMAIGDFDQLTRTDDFSIEPENNIGSCCEIGNCEELYFSELNDACALDSDCIDALVCIGGLCKEISVEGSRVARGKSFAVSAAILQLFVFSMFACTL
jgi:dopamine beta-monooxygenase